MSDLDRPRRCSRKLTEARTQEIPEAFQSGRACRGLPTRRDVAAAPRGRGEKEMEKKEGREKPMTQEQKSAARQEPLQVPQTIAAF